jgi:osmoprotectant transport system substrate-binding protein
MRSRSLTLAVAAIGLSASLAACGESGSSSDSTSGKKGCAPVSGDEIVVLADSKKLQSVDNIIPAINTKAASAPLTAALDKVSDELDTDTLVGLNRQVDVERKTSKVAAETYVAKTQLDQGLEKGSGKIVVGAANFGESQTLANVYALVLKGAGFDASVKTVGNRELYLPALEKGELSVVPEYVGTLTEFLNKKTNGPDAEPQASSDLDKTVAALTALGEKSGLTFGKPSEAADQNAFAVNKKLATEKNLKTLEDFAEECSGADTILAGPPECQERPFCKPGLEETYGIEFGGFAAFDAAGPLTKSALKKGDATIGLVLSSDGGLATLG